MQVGPWLLWRSPPFCWATRCRSALKLFTSIESLEDAVYFVLVTSTTLGYGDVTLERKWRLFGAMAAVNGLLTFGLSTAFLLDVFAKVYGS